jgi:hypothetical protein
LSATEACGLGMPGRARRVVIRITGYMDQCSPAKRPILSALPLRICNAGPAAHFGWPFSWASQPGRRSRDAARDRAQALSPEPCFI